MSSNKSSDQVQPSSSAQDEGPMTPPTLPLRNRNNWPCSTTSSSRHVITMLKNFPVYRMSNLPDNLKRKFIDSYSTAANCLVELVSSIVAVTGSESEVQEKALTLQNSCFTVHKIICESFQAMYARLNYAPQTPNWARAIPPAAQRIPEPGPSLTFAAYQLVEKMFVLVNDAVCLVRKNQKVALFMPAASATEVVNAEVAKLQDIFFRFREAIKQMVADFGTAVAEVSGAAVRSLANATVANFFATAGPDVSQIRFPVFSDEFD